MTSTHTSSRVVVLDTDAFSILFLKPRTFRDQRTAGWRAELLGSTVVISVQTRAEILYGVLRAGWGPARVHELHDQLNRTFTVPVSAEVVTAYAELRAACARVGHALHQKQHGCDAWVAATAISIGAPLLAGDRIYRDAPGLTVLLDTLP